MLTHLQVLAAALVLVVAPAIAFAAPAGNSKAKGESAAEIVRKALDQPIDVDLVDQPMINAINVLKEQTKVNIVVDNFTLAQNGIDVNTAQVSVKQQGVKGRAALKAVLSQYHLGYAIIGDSVIITTEEMALHRQLKQKISVDLEKVAFDTAIKDLAKETAVQLLVDKKVSKEAQTPVSLQLEDVQLETIVRLLCEQAELKPVRMGNVLYVTANAKAKELRAEPDLAPNPNYQGGPGNVQDMINIAPGMIGGGGGIGGLGGLVPAIKGAIAPPVDAPVATPPAEDKKEEKKEDKKDDKKEDKKELDKKEDKK
jgi:hypothetical protein